MADHDTDPRLTALLDQRDADARAMAATMIAVYRELREGGLPDQLAAGMVGNAWASWCNRTTLETMATLNQQQGDT